MRVKVFNSHGRLVSAETARVVKSDAEWSRELTPQQCKVARRKGTERAFCGTLLDNKQNGVYSCVCCGLPLFASGNKFDSGTGWPSFFTTVADENVVRLGRPAEIHCARCDAHLGHVFEDGPPPTGLRYCVNSESLKFTDEQDLFLLADPAAK